MLCYFPVVLTLTIRTPLAESTLNDGKGGVGAVTIMETMATMVNIINIIKTTVALEELSRRQAMIAFIHKYNKNK